MMNFLRHTDFIELSRYADGELDAEARIRVEAHLHACAKCRTELRFIEQLGAAARELPAPGPSEDALDRVLARRAAGERVIVPLDGPIGIKKGNPRGFLGLAAAVAATLLAAMAALVMLAPRAEADRGALEFSTDEPRAGQEVEVEYRTGRLFEGETRLLLRARYRYEGGTTEQLVAAELPRTDDDVYSARVLLPDSVAYAVFAVEDPSASRVDSNGRRLWELVVHGEDGRPTFAGLKERANDLRGRNLEVAYQTALRMTELYPLEPQSWYLRVYMESLVLPASRAEALRPAHVERAGEFLALVPSLTADQLAWLLDYATALGVVEVATATESRLRQVSPRHSTLVQLDMRRTERRLSDDPAELLLALEELWTRGSDVRSLAAAGIRVAQQAGDIEALARWGSRTDAVAPQNRLQAAILMARTPGIRDLGLAELRTVLRGLEATSDLDRGLFESASAFDYQRGRDIQRVLATLGEALVASGRTAAGIDTLRLAAERGWNPAVFRAGARAHTALGDTSAALDFLARVTVDPGTPPSERDSIASLALRYLRAAEWQAEVAVAEQTMRKMVLASGVRRHLDPELELLAADGAPVAFDDVRAGRAAVVSFWSRRASVRSQQLPEMSRIAQQLQARGAKFIAVTDESPTAALREFAMNELPAVEVFSDASGEVAHAFGQWGVPEFFVVDADGVIRFEYTNLEDALRQVAVLLPPATAPTVADQ